MRLSTTAYYLLSVLSFVNTDHPLATIIKMYFVCRYVRLIFLYFLF